MLLCPKTRYVSIQNCLTKGPTANILILREYLTGINQSFEHQKQLYQISATSIFLATDRKKIFRRKEFLMIIK